MTNKQSLFRLVFILVFIASCTDEGIDIPYFDFVFYSPGPQDTGSASASVFDKSWGATAYIFPFQQDTQYMAVRFETYTDEGFIRDELLFGDFGLKEGYYSIVADSSAGKSPDDYLVYGGYSQYQDDGDVVNGFYELDHQHRNDFYIDRIDTAARIIEGRFDVLFRLREEFLHKNLAKRILFENGKFAVNY